jgi:hypothetical protein
VTTGRQLIERALREPMQATGWAPRAAGWFTTPLAPGYTGVVAVGVASQHAAPGTGSATLHVHLRREDVQPVVHDLLELTEKDGGYRSPTASTSIGYLMPEAAWREWLVTSETATAVADELAAATRDYAYPYLQRLTTDPELLLEAVKSSAAMASAAGPCTVAVILARIGRTDEARAYTEQTVAALGARTDPAAQQTRQMADRLRDWVGQLVG